MKESIDKVYYREAYIGFEAKSKDVNHLTDFLTNISGQKKK